MKKKQVKEIQSTFKCHAASHFSYSWLQITYFFIPIFPSILSFGVFIWLYSSFFMIITIDEFPGLIPSLETDLVSWLFLAVSPCRTQIDHGRYASRPHTNVDISFKSSFHL